MALTKNQKETNKKLTDEAKKNKPANLKAAADEAKSKKKTVTLSDAEKTRAASSAFGGMLGKAANALKGRKGQGDE